MKFDVLGVREGPVVSAEAAEQMAAGVCRLFHADIGLATTGVAGPRPQEDQPAGTAWLGWSVDGRTGSRQLRFDGDPEEIRTDAVETVFAALPGLVEGSTVSRPR